ncbi:hypothetical protein [Coraliomargarita parva]|uniref:hypothetical protein n=1 Tax=Coraliomargarita parva TaxID=3014050 RepID=UPI0022B43785|nr:hypothetical protein [Coraliomargarita parva]
MTPHSKLRIIVGGMVGQFPLGGVAWDYFHYVLAFHELGHDVLYHEDTNTWPYNPSIREPSSDGLYAAQFIQSFFERYAPELSDKWHYKLLGDKSFGMSDEAFAEFAQTADIYLNVSGCCTLPTNLSDQCKRVFLDSDPGYNQFGLQELLDSEGPQAPRYMEVAELHNVHLTYAENIHNQDCRLPKCGIDWITTRPIATLQPWSKSLEHPIPADAAYTTVMTLDLEKTPKRLHYDGVDYFDKRVEFEKFIDLPLRYSSTQLKLAIGNNNDTTHAALEHHGWGIIDAHHASITPETYLDFISSSYGEWSIAKNVYVQSRSGWFSCRTCCYLAAGRPAVVQDTTWSRFVPSGSGLFAFTTMDEAIAAMETIERDPMRQRRLAYEIAREYLSPDKVIAPMIDDIMRSDSNKIADSLS